MSIFLTREYTIFGHVNKYVNKHIWIQHENTTVSFPLYDVLFLMGYVIIVYGSVLKGYAIDSITSIVR